MMSNINNFKNPMNFVNTGFVYNAYDKVLQTNMSLSHGLRRPFRRMDESRGLYRAFSEMDLIQIASLVKTCKDDPQYTKADLG